MALWSLLGPLPVEVLAWETFGLEWAKDILEQLRLDARVHRAAYGHLPDLKQADAMTSDVVFTWNGTTSGVRIPNADWIPTTRAGLTICDATSAVFAQPLPFAKLDVTTFSWQKALGGEGAHGVLILSPRAVERLEQHTPAWPIPRIFQLTHNGKLNERIFAGDTINTPSLLCVEDYLDALQWAESIGGHDALTARTESNAAELYAWIDRTEWVEPLAAAPETRSTTSVCLTINPPVGTTLAEVADLHTRIAELLAREGIAFDIAAHRDAPAGLRIWCGATIDLADIQALTQWLDWAWRVVCAESLTAVHGTHST